MRGIVFVILLFAGCTMSFQPFPSSVSKQDLDAVIQALNEQGRAIMALQQQGVSKKK